MVHLSCSLCQYDSIRIQISFSKLMAFTVQKYPILVKIIQHENEIATSFGV